MKYLILLLVLSGCTDYADVSLNEIEETRKECVLFKKHFDAVKPTNFNSYIADKVSLCKRVGGWDEKVEVKK